MEMWEKALFKFLEQWESEEYVLAAVATGSYAVGNNTYKSDIDVHIVLSNDVDWRERGNKYVDGYLIEYFANPAKQIYQYMDDDLECGTRMDANMFYTGKVIFDKTGIIAELKRRAEEYLIKEFKEVDLWTLEMMKYGIWDFFEEIQESYETKSSDFIYLCCLYLEQILEKYGKFLKTTLPAKYKVYKFFKNEEYRRRYNLNELPDKEFVSKFLVCIEEHDREKRYKNISELKGYVLERMGGFDIDGWKLRSPLAIK